MANVFVFTVYLILIVLYATAVLQYRIEKSLCLETVLVFMNGHKNCDFTEIDAQNSLENERTTCQTKCEVKLEGINEDNNTLWAVYITFDSSNYEFFPCPKDGHHNMLSMFINCPKSNTVKVPVGGYCKLDKQCQGSGYFGACEHGRCVCRTGYVLFNLECYKGNLTLNQPCSFSEQCTGSPYVSCPEGYCSYIEEYTATNSADCVRDSNITFASSLQLKQEETNIGATLGALFGGLLLGVILTTVAVMIIYWRSKKHFKKREELNVTFAENDSYAKVVHRSDFQTGVQTKDKTPEVSLYSGLKVASVTDQASEKPRNEQTQDDVYNHLYEQVKRDGTNYYDHTSAATAHNGDMDDYSHLRHATS